MTKIGLLGLGTVGTGFVEILKNREKEILNLLEDEISIKKVLVKNIDKKRPVELNKDILTLDFEDILYDDEISIVDRKSVV